LGRWTVLTVSRRSTVRFRKGAPSSLSFFEINSHPICRFRGTGCRDVPLPTLLRLITPNGYLSPSVTDVGGNGRCVGGLAVSRRLLLAARWWPRSTVPRRVRPENEIVRLWPCFVFWAGGQDVAQQGQQAGGLDPVPGGGGQFLGGPTVAAARRIRRPPGWNGSGRRDGLKSAASRRPPGLVTRYISRNAACRWGASPGSNGIVTGMRGT
jgi:hypothetical protein